MLRQNGGVIMICFLRDLVKPASGIGEPTLSDVADHIIYAGEKIGYEHVGIGSDFDGMLRGPEGLDEVSDYPRLVATLLRKGVTEEWVRQVAGLNILRVLDDVQKAVAKLRLHHDIAPACDDIPTTWTPEQREMVVEEGKRRISRRSTAMKSEKSP